MRPAARTARVVAAAAAVAVAALAAGCGDDDGGSSGTTRSTGTTADTEEDTTVSTESGTGGGSDAVPAERVELTADVRLDGSRVVFDYTLANTRDEPVAIVDPGSVVDTLEPAGEDGYRAAFLRTEGDPAGGPLPMIDGLVVAAGAEATGTARITGEFERLLATVELCIEVAPQPWADAGGGVARFPYRETGTPPELACTGPIPVPGAPA
jgi:hypothetical protein